jgi:hypothetical protein
MDSVCFLFVTRSIYNNDGYEDELVDRVRRERERERERVFLRLFRALK